MTLEIKHRVIPEHAQAVRADLQALEAAGQLAPGSSGPEVKALQRLLRGLDLYGGEINGTYDAATTAAVKKLEGQTKGANGDGSFDAAELKEARGRQMFVKDGFQTPVRIGQKGAAVRELEHKLEHFGYDVGEVDGVFDSNLQKAVKAYRKDDPKLADKFESAGPKFIQSLRRKVHQLEADLKKLGRKPGKVDGSYTQKTEAAVKAFQRKHDLKVTGNANARTLAAIHREASDGISDKTQKFIDIAKAQTGDPYVWGAEGPNAFDCSGLVCYALNHAGVNVPRLTASGYQDMYRNNKVSREHLKPGDLVFFHYEGPSGHASHIEIYVGHGRTMGTDHPGEPARVEPIDWSAFIGGARVPGLQH